MTLPANWCRTPRGAAQCTDRFLNNSKTFHKPGQVQEEDAAASFVSLIWDLVGRGTWQQNKWRL